MEQNNSIYTVLILVVTLAPGISRAQGPSSWQFEADKLVISVTTSDAEYEDTRSYQVAVANDIRTLSRVDVNRDGVVTNAWLTDLDNDDAFEIVVSVSQLGGGNIGAADIHEWNGFRFDSSRVARLSGAQEIGYQGYDQFEIVNGRLTRSFPRFEDKDGSRTPSGQMSNFEYRFKEQRWVAPDQ
ncbi:MAG: hypothetical protein O3C28_04175 [Proteobacteria bacterium]|nr:hypothetical protein [Pseudomonadota bacterium]